MLCHLTFSRSPKAWASRATFANGNTCCGLVIENLRVRPRNPRKPVFDSRAYFCHSALMETHPSASDSGRTPRRAKSDFLSVQ
jgi:hypothetical protein